MSNDREVKEHIDERKEYALSNTDIQDTIDGTTNIFTYPHLKDVHHIDELFDPKGRAIMLFLTENENVGHWIALLRRGDTIEIYDPYGYNPSQWKNKLGGAMSDMRDWFQDKPLLESKIKEAGYGMTYNKQQAQEVSPNINTCGRHSVMRLLFSNLTLDEYNKMLKNIKNNTGIDPDTLATALTEEILGK